MNFPNADFVHQIANSKLRARFRLQSLHDFAFDRKPIHGGAYPLRLSLGGRWYCRIDAYLDMHLLYCTSSREAGGDGHVSTQTMKR